MLVWHVGKQAVRGRYEGSKEGVERGERELEADRWRTEEKRRRKMRKREKGRDSARRRSFGGPKAVRGGQKGR